MSGFQSRVGLTEGANGGVITDTELGEATSLADGKSNGSAVEIDAKLSGYNGARWDRIRTEITSPTSSATGILSTISLAKYNSSSPTFSDGQIGSLQVDINGNLKVTGTELSSIVSNTAISTTGPTNGTKTVPTGSAEAISGSVAATKGVLVISDSGNSAIVYVGGSAVTTSNGVDLNPGDARFYEVNNGNLIYCISGSAVQTLRYEIL